MSVVRFDRSADGAWVAHVKKRGRDVLRDPLINKGTSFSTAERTALDIEGLLPVGVATVEQQEQRVHDALDRAPDAIGKYIELADLHDRNETLFYRMLVDRAGELLPIVYTPTVGEACFNFSHIFRRGRGRWISPDQRGRIREVLSQIKGDIRLIVVTDNERILGLGDQGAGGMGIPIGKLALYTAGAGIHPSQTLPVSLDVGTQNERLRSDPLYLGFEGPRLRGDDYVALIDEFVEAVREVFPKALVQWEDFKKGNAFALLARYRDVLPSFNDDIQGTAAVAVAGIVAAGRIAGQPLEQQRTVILGGGAAGVGIAQHLRHALAEAGLSGDELLAAIANLDSHGLIVESPDIVDDYKHEFAWPLELAERFALAPGADLATVVEQLRPTVLIGTSGHPGLFTEPVVRSMAARCERPAIFPFSNPTTKSEAVPEDLLRWTDGRALIATGSPFAPVEYGGRTHCISQGNNVYVFPGVGLGALAVGARKVTDGMFARAAVALAEQVSPADLDAGRLYPPLSGLRQVTRQIAVAVGKQAVQESVAVEPRAGVSAVVDHWMWWPDYPEIVPE